MLTGPSTVSCDSVPMLVINGCALVLTVPLRLVKLPMLAMTSLVLIPTMALTTLPSMLPSAYTLPRTQTLPERILPDSVAVVPAKLPRRVGADICVLAITLDATRLPLVVIDVNVPTLVILGCIAVNSVPVMLPEISVFATAKSVTTVPITMALELELIILPMTLRLPPTVRLVRLPTVVMFGWLAVRIGPENPAACTVPEAVRFPLVVLPVTAKLTSVPTRVILVWVVVTNVPVRILAVSLLVEMLALRVLIFPESMLPVTARIPRVPMLVIRVCTGVSKVPAMLVNVPVEPLTLPVLAFPLTVSNARVPTPVIPACTPAVSVPAIVVAVSLPAVMLLETTRFPRVPIVVMYGCAAVCTVPDTTVKLPW